MGNNAGQLALLAAGYLLGRAKGKSIRNVLLVAGGVAYGRITSSQSDDESSGSMLSRLGSSSLADAAREAVTTTATKGMESLNKNLQSRAEALRGTSQEDSDQDVDDEATAEEEDVEETDETEEESTKATKGGGN